MCRGAVIGLLFLVGCAEEVPAREAIIVNTMTEADLPLIRSRRELVATKYRLMGATFYTFFRGTFPLYLRDATDSALPIGDTSYPVAGALPLGIGDAHPENFGLLVASDKSFAIEGNDFDGADRYPFHWELRRLCTGMAIAARIAGQDASSEDVARAVARAYAEMILTLDDGAAPPRITAAPGNPIAEDLFERGREDYAAREELDELTVLEGGTRRLKRGEIDPDAPENLYIELPTFALDALPQTIADYRETLIDPPPPEFFTVLDAARELASGVASIPRVRVIVLVRGDTDAASDDVILEMKELADSGAQGWIGVGVSANSVQERVIRSTRTLWARADAEPFWGTSSFLGFPVQLKLESEGHKTLRVARFIAELAEPAALTELARLLGGLLARMQSASGEELTSSIADAIGFDLDAFAAEHAAAGVRYADQLAEDWRHFQNALERLGPLLGVRFDPSDRASPELQALYGLREAR